jgi:hypothetical protein
MNTCENTIIIEAPLRRVWEILSDFDRYPEWNPLIGKIRGTVDEGALVLAYVCPLKVNFPVRIISFKPMQEIIWQGRIPSASLMQGEHYYYLKDLGNNSTELIHGENFTGWLSDFMPAFLLSELQDAYEYHNQKIKVIAECG